jgi:hypothetical protein
VKEIALTVRPFSEQELFRALANDDFDEYEVANQGRAKYLSRYLQRLDAKSIIVEDPYTDADYLDDYSSYYVRCHTTYKSRCKRLHFFASHIQDGWFEASLTEAGLAELQKAYLGFIVARPLPDAIIGRTVLCTYDDDHGRREYSVKLDYDVHLCGLNLRVCDSLAFQEQDTVLAACATVALWSCLQKTAGLFHTPVPSPSAITRAATQFTHQGRPIPSHGLVVAEICTAIRHNGLEPELFEVTDKQPFASLLYGYLQMGLPVVLGIQAKGHGGHAIALTGFSKQAKRVRNSERGTQVPMRGLRLDALYGHDDQAGPFSRISLVPTRRSPGVFLESQDYIDEITGKPLELWPTVIIVPVYHKIRIRFPDVQGWITQAHRLFRLWLNKVDLEWDVRLCMASDYKADLQTSDWLPVAIRDRGLRQDLPRFLWRATLWADGHAAVDLLFDATGLARTVPFVSASWLGEALASKIEEFMNSESCRSTVDALLTARFSREIKKSLAERHAHDPAGASSA